MLKRIYDVWYLKPFLKAFGVVPIAAGQSQESLQTINALLRAGECVCLFPEGAISRNGHLGKFHTGYERTLDGVEDGVIIPFYLHGLWGSSLSRAGEGLRDARTPDIKRDLIIAFGPPLPLDTSAKVLKQKIFQLSINAWQSYSEQLEPIPLAWLRTARRKPSQRCAVDESGRSLTNAQMVAAVVGLSRKLKLAGDEHHVGVLLPAGTAALQAILALLLRGKVIVPLNHTLPPDVFSTILRTTSVRHVVTSRTYLAKLSDSGIAIDELLRGRELVYLEDLASGMSRWRQVLDTIGFRLLPVSWFYGLGGQVLQAEDHAAILLSENSESDPLAVLLSHRNIMANCKQMSDVLNTRLDDVILSCLPLYHPLGLTLTTIMPLVEGIPVACHGDPLDSLGIAKSVARHRATLLPASPQTLGLYVRNRDIHPLMLDPLRLVVSGAEPLSDDLRAKFELKFGKRVYEGYGAAETTAVSTVNIPDAMDTSDWKVQQGNIPGTMGMPLPGTCLKIVDEHSGREVPLETDGLLLVCGSQVMSGYLDASAYTAAAIFETDGQRWFRTGRTGHLTQEGFLVMRAQ